MPLPSRPAGASVQAPLGRLAGTRPNTRLSSATSATQQGASAAKAAQAALSSRRVKK